MKYLLQISGLFGLLYGVYLIKSAIGIDLIPEYHLSDLFLQPGNVIKTIIRHSFLSYSH